MLEEERRHPVGGVDYPRTLQEFDAWFPSETACVEQLASTHLDYYLDEYAFRFNRRQSRAPGMLFYRLLEQSVNADPVAYCQLIGGKRA